MLIMPNPYRLTTGIILLDAKFIDITDPIKTDDIRVCNLLENIQQERRHEPELGKRGESGGHGK